MVQDKKEKKDKKSKKERKKEKKRFVLPCTSLCMSQTGPELFHCGVCFLRHDIPGWKRCRRKKEKKEAKRRKKEGKDEEVAHEQMLITLLKTFLNLYFFP